MDRPLGSKYVLHELLGRGAMGEVYRASVRDSDGSLAVKVLKPELVSDPEVVARFFQERSILTSIDHPNVVRVLDLVAEGETVAIVMDLAGGSDLRRILRERGPLPPAEAVQVVGQLLDGLTAVHAAGIVHRDVKPENILLDTSGDQMLVRLTDFGVSRLTFGGSLTKLSSVIGTPEYIAPEVAEHGSAAAAADIYAAGIVLYELLCGRTPFAGGHTMAVLRRITDSPPPPIPGMPDALSGPLASMLAKSPGERPESAAAAAALVAAAGSLAGLPALPVLAEPGPGAWTPVTVTSPPGRAAGAGTVPGANPPGGTAPGSPSQGRTVLRRRDRGAGPDQVLTSLSSNGERGLPGSAGPLAGLVGPGRHNLRSRPALFALPVALVVVAAAAGVLLTRSPRPTSQAGSQAAVSYAFAPQQYSDGLLIVRRWTLSGSGGSVLTETVTASSATGRAMDAVFDEAIPDTIARTLQTVRFTPAPSKIVRADPIVEWDLRVPAQGTVTVGYAATVPAAGTARTRLMGWAGDLSALQASAGLRSTVTVSLRSLSLSPRSLSLATGGMGTLVLSGVLIDGSAASPSILAGAAWTTGNPAVAIVDSSGTVTGIGVGTTYVTAQVGTSEAMVAVTVTGSQPTLALGGSTSAGANPVATGGGNLGGNPKPKTSTPTPVVHTSTVTPPPPPPPPAPTYWETTGGVTHTWTNYTNAGGTQGASIPAYATVQVTCRLIGFKVSDGNTWWYKIASSPWSNSFYASADAFYNDGATSGSLIGTPFVDTNVPVC